VKLRLTAKEHAKNRQANTEVKENKKAREPLNTRIPGLLGLSLSKKRFEKSLLQWWSYTLSNVHLFMRGLASAAER
jgi:hypothetical protein